MLNIVLRKNSIINPLVKKSHAYISADSAINPNGLKYKPILIMDSLEFIAKGAQGSVHRILGSNLAVKIKNNTNLKECFKEPITFNLNEAEKINHIKAKIGSNIALMEFIKGEQIKGQFNQKCFKIDKIKDYLEYVYKASQKGMRHDIGGRNVIFDQTSGKMTPIDFYPNKPGYKHCILNDAFIQLNSSAKTAKEAESLLSKIALGFLELIKTNAISAKGLSKISAELKTVEDLIRTNENLRASLSFINSLENNLKIILQEKSLQGILPDADKNMFSYIEKLENDLKSRVI